jgi:hypothetical protein
VVGCVALRGDAQLRSFHGCAALQLELGLPQRAQHLVRQLEQARAGGGDDELATIATKQRHAQALFQTAQLMTHGRLAQVKLLGCARSPASFGDGSHQAQIARLERSVIGVHE